LLKLPRRSQPFKYETDKGVETGITNDFLATELRHARPDDLVGRARPDDLVGRAPNCTV